VVLDKLKEDEMQRMGHGGYCKCPECGSPVGTQDLKKHELTNPHPSAYDTKFQGRTLRSRGIYRKGVFYIGQCVHCGSDILAEEGGDIEIDDDVEPE